MRPHLYYKIAASRGEPKRRIWLEGDRVLAAGFAVGMFYTREWRADGAKFDRVEVTYDAGRITVRGVAS